MELKRSGNIPTNIPNSIINKYLDPITKGLIEESISNINISDISSKFINNNIYINDIFIRIINSTNIFNSVEGYLDDLVG